MINQARMCLLLLGLLLVGATTGAAQTPVSGRVINAESMSPIAGALVVVEGTNTRTVTASDGRFTINAPGTGTLVVSNLGFTQNTVAIGGRSTLDISLSATVLQLDEIVAVGYTQQTQRSITGAVASVQSGMLEDRKVATVEDAIKGRLAGVSVRTSGEPGEAAAINIRGQAFTADNSPLYVVDGMYLRQNPGLNPSDIESIQILKDASAASQYGAQAANGVVIIQTKQGRAAEGNRITIRSYYGRTETPRMLPMMNSQQWAKLTQMKYDNAKTVVPSSPTYPVGVLEVLNGQNTVDTNWQDEILRPGYMQDHNVSMSGGTTAGDANYFLSGGYTQREGEILDTNYERYTLRANSTLRRGRLTIGENLAISRSNRTSAEGGVLEGALGMIPAIPVRNENDTYGIGTANYPTFSTNPVGNLELNDNTDRDDQLIGTVYADLEILPFLSYRGQAGFRHNNNEGDSFSRVGTLRQNTDRGPATLTIENDTRSSLLLENLLTLSQVTGPHNINAVLGATQQRNTETDFLGRRRNFALSREGLRVLGAGTENIENQHAERETRLNSYLARVSYSLADKYMLEGSFRRDGSSRFGPANRWGNFWAASAGWVLSEETFFQNLPVLGSADFLKVRGSYGTLGNQDFADYEWQANMTPNRNYIFGPGSSSQVRPGMILMSIPNEQLKWQENTMQNYGIDVGLLDNQLSLTAEYYISKSGDLLVRIPIVSSLGSEQSPFINAGSIQNSGFEFSAQHTLTRPNFELSSGLNFTTIRNEVTSLGSGGLPSIIGVSRLDVGLPMGALWTYDMLGIFQSQDEVLNHKNSKGVVLQPRSGPGDVKFADTNDDGLINEFDRRMTGNPWPAFEGGAFLDGRMGRFDFNVGMRGSFGAEIYNGFRAGVESMVGDSNSPSWLEPWTPENRSTTTPRALFNIPQGNENARPSQRYIEDGSYVKLQNVQVGYQLPTGLLGAAGLQNNTARVYVNLQNIHTFTDYRGYDPEFIRTGTNAALQRGEDSGNAYPNPRSITIGIDLDL